MSSYQSCTTKLVWSKFKYKKAFGFVNMTAGTSCRKLGAQINRINESQEVSRCVVNTLEDSNAETPDGISANLVTRTRRKVQSARPRVSRMTSQPRQPDSFILSSADFLWAHVFLNLMSTEVVKGFTSWVAVPSYRNWLVASFLLVFDVLQTVSTN